MSNRKVIRKERHHWWPMSLSKHWIGSAGSLNRIDTENTQIQIFPKNAARISDAHNIYFDNADAWQETYEHVFDRPDSAFRPVVSWLDGLVENHHQGGLERQGEYSVHEYKSSQLDTFVSCIVSLAVRSPRMRNKVVSLVSSLRASVQKREMMNLVALNLRDLQKTLCELLYGQGKFVLLISTESEFIFGDGFYHNLPIQAHGTLHEVTILAPITPRIAVMYVRPMEYMVEPRLLARSADKSLVDLVNESIQVYSKDYLFYRSKAPTLTDYFLRNEHLLYSNGDPVAAFAKGIPGVIDNSWRAHISNL